MIMCVLLCYPVSIHMSQLQATGRPISSFPLYMFNKAIVGKLKKVQNVLFWGGFHERSQT